MSGGTFDYDQDRINGIIDKIDRIISKNNVEIPKKDQWYDEAYYQTFPRAKYYSSYSDKTIEEFKNALKYLKIAYVYARRIDWLVAGDDMEETFHRRLKEELNKLEEN